MKKRLFSILLALVLVLILLPTTAGAYYPYVIDEAGALSDDEKSTLEEEAKRISEEYGCGVYIVIAQSTQGQDVFEYAMDVYSSLDRGYGVDRDGEMLLLSMAERDYSLIAYGPFGNAAFTDYGKDVLAEEFLDNFAEDDWYGGFYDYLVKSESMLYDAALGTPLDTYVDQTGGAAYTPAISPEISFWDEWISNIGTFLLFGIVISAIFCLIAWRRSKSVHAGGSAHDYLMDDSVRITGRRDAFSHRTETRTLIETNSSSGGGTRVNSRGFSGKSGKF